MRGRVFCTVALLPDLTSSAIDAPAARISGLTPRADHVLARPVTSTARSQRCLRLATVGGLTNA